MRFEALRTEPKPARTPGRVLSARRHGFVRTLRIPETAYADRFEPVSVGPEHVRQAGVMEKQAPDEQIVDTLVCLECRTECGRARGWRAYLDTEACLLVYCQQCAAREFDA